MFYRSYKYLRYEIGRVFVNICKYLLILYYQCLSTKENREFTFLVVLHWVDHVYRWWKYRCKHILHWLLRIEKSKADQECIGVFLSDLLQRTRCWWDARNSYMEPFIQFEQWLVESVFSRHIVNVKYVGSFPETLQSLHYSQKISDIDMMYIYKGFQLNSRQKAADGTHISVVDTSKPGYVRLEGYCPKKELIETYCRIADNGQFEKSLQVEQLMKDFEKNVISSEFPNGRYLLRSDYFRFIHHKFCYSRFDEKLEVQSKGPAINLVKNLAGLKGQVIMSSLEIVFAVHCDEWPKQAEEWLIRQRKHATPKKCLIEKIREYGVDIVPKSTYQKTEMLNVFQWLLRRDNAPIESGKEKYEWRISFSIAELMLTRSWSKQQRKVYQFVKTVRHDYFDGPGIGSYALKNIMLYMIEETDSHYWSEKNFLQIVNDYFDRLLMCIENENCPHYFIKSYNLFNIKIYGHRLKKVSEICRWVQSNWKDAIYLSDGLWFIIKYENMKQYFYDVLRDKESFRRTHKSELKQQGPDAKNYGGICKVYYAYKVHTKCKELMTNAGKSLNYNVDVVMNAIYGFIKKSDGEKLSAEQDILLAQICWSFMKFCRRQKKECDNDSVTPQAITSRDEGENTKTRAVEKVRKISSLGETDVPLKWREKYFDVANIMFYNKTAKYIWAADLIMREKINEAREYLEQLDNKSAMKELVSRNDSPVMIGYNDMPAYTRDFNFNKDELFFCPASLLKALVGKKKSKEGHWNRVNELWDGYPYELKRVRKFKYMLLHLSHYLYYDAKIKRMIRPG